MIAIERVHIALFQAFNYAVFRPRWVEARESLSGAKNKKETDQKKKELGTGVLRRFSRLKSA
jgi:hypothetical protein